MISLKHTLTTKLTLDRSNHKHVTFFIKCLYAFLLFKIIFLWPLTSDISAYKAFTYTSFLNYFLFAPLALTKINLDLFLYFFVVLIIASLVLRLNYFTGFLICWFSISLSRLFLSIINGSDLVLNLFLMISIVLPTYPKFKREEWVSVQNLISNTALLLAQIQLALIYLLSGYDKLLSPEWRSGAAIASINLLKFYNNPFLTINLNETLSWMLSWSVILFELAFALLIWFNYARKPLLIIGVLFHLVIGIYLGLFDFALVMVICYGVYLPFKKNPLGSIALSGI